MHKQETLTTGHTITDVPGARELVDLGHAFAKLDFRGSYTVQEAADLLRVTTATVYELVHRGELPATRVGRQFRFGKFTFWSYMNGLDSSVFLEDLMEKFMRQHCCNEGHCVTTLTH